MSSEESNDYVAPPDASAATYAEIETEVNLHFKGVWPDFLRAIRNPAEVMNFILTEHCEGDEARFAQWAREQNLPEAWLSRFHLAMAQIQMQGGRV